MSKTFEEFSNELPANELPALTDKQISIQDGGVVTTTNNQIKALLDANAIVSLTYAEAEVLVAASGLNAGGLYLITDATDGNIELILTAATTSAFYGVAIDPVAPNDVLKYDFDTDAISWRWGNAVNVGVGATDFQMTREDSSQTASGPRSFIGGGQNNKATDDDGFVAGESNTIESITNMGKDAFAGFIVGRDNFVHDWAGLASGIGNIVDGKIAGAIGNANVSSSNDGVALGNRTWNGRRYYPDITTGSEDAGSGLGVLQYFIIPDVEGDVSAFFPNALITAGYVTTNYGSGAQKDTLGNVYADGYTPAIWSGETLVAPNDLTWALHRACLVRGTGEQQIVHVTIEKAVYSGGSGTKVYYRGAKPFTTLIGAASSYSPQVFVSGSTVGGNGAMTGGVFASTWGYASTAFNSFTRAWASFSAAFGDHTEALGIASFVSGYLTKAKKQYSRAGGDRSVADGESSVSEGVLCATSGYASKAQNQETQALSQASFAINRGSIADGANTFATGLESRTFRQNAQAYSSGKRSTVGDNQNTKIQYQRLVADAGWYEISLLDDCEDGKAYNFRSMVMGRQTASAGAGTVGNTFAYQFTGLFTVAGGVITTIGTPTRTLIGRTTGMTGDGLTTGPRISYSGYYTSGRCVYRYDGEADTTFFIQTFSEFQEILL